MEDLMFAENVKYDFLNLKAIHFLDIFDCYLQLNWTE